MRYQIYEAKSVKHDAQQRVGMKTKTDAVLTFGQCLFFWCSKRTAWAEIKRGPSVA